jgi:TusA-related sulfurtransferase
MEHLIPSQAHIQLDLRGTPCPINFVKAKLQLEEMQSGEILEIWLDDGEPIEQVPDSLTMAGYIVEEKQKQNDFWQLRIHIPL